MIVEDVERMGVADPEMQNPRPETRRRGTRERVAVNRGD